MIRYPIPDEQLLQRIDEVKGTWLQRARDATARHQEAGQFTTKSPDWSEIKSVFMKLQHDKCAYCERKLWSEKYGKIEHDVEHFRPKNTVESWPTEAIASERGLSYDFPTGDRLEDGYHLLAHEPRNYATACKPCNTPLKKNYFPIEGARVVGERDVRAYASEQALLPFPIGERGIRPEDVITFVGHWAVQRKKTGHLARMGKVTIDFFDLNHDSLQKSRARVVCELYMAHRWRDLAPPDSEDVQLADAAREVLLTDAYAHAACARAFDQVLCHAPEVAERLYRQALRLQHQ